MSEYRAAIGRFAGIAKKASCSGKRKWKRPKLANMGKIKSEETHLEKQNPISPGGPKAWEARRVRPRAVTLVEEAEV